MTGAGDGWPSAHPPRQGRIHEAPESAPRKGLAIAALVLGIDSCVSLWFVFESIPLGVIAIILGIIAMRRARRGQATGRGMAVAGIVLGALGIIATIVALIVGFSVIGKEGAETYEDWLEHADTGAEGKQCDKEFEKEFDGNWDRGADSPARDPRSFSAASAASTQ